MSPSLMDKLRMIGTEQGAPRAPAPEDDPPSEDCYTTRAEFPLSSFSPLRHMTQGALWNVFGLQTPGAPLKPEQLIFLDTETTGLSGGVGTLAFQVGVGYIRDGRFVVEQYLMRDYPEEPYMLSLLCDTLRPFRALVTFNGRSFDAPLLRNRLLLNRLDVGAIPDLHFDLLYPSRRLWKLRLGSCRLSRLEEELLGVCREDDLPGALVPQTYFQYLKDRRFEPIHRILLHNRQDIVSLAQLFFYVCMVYERPEQLQYGQDLFSMAQALTRAGDRTHAAKCYRLSAVGGQRAGAYQALARIEKQSGSPLRAVRLYQAMLKNGDEPVQAAVALAKLFEHRLHDPEQALSYTRQALLMLSEPTLRDQDEAVQTQRNEVQYRYSRLLGKLRQNTR